MKKGVKRFAIGTVTAVFVLAMVIGIIPSPLGDVSTLEVEAAETITPVEPQKVDDVYQIGTKEELYWFAGLVNGTLEGVKQNTYANAVLTADITVNKNVLDTEGKLKGDGSGYSSWTPIGASSNYNYGGIFDGNGHVISGLYASDSAFYVGFFGRNYGMIKNVRIVDSYFYGTKYIGSIVADNAKMLTNCYSDCTVESTGRAAYIGGLCGTNNDGMITNCLSTGRVISESVNQGIFCAQVRLDGELISDGVIENGYYLADAEADEIEGTTGLTAAQLKTGEAAYWLQGIQDSHIWGQKIGVDSYPVLGGAKVYYNEETGAYYNDESIDVCEHVDENLDGYCDKGCDSYAAKGACGVSMTWSLDMDTHTLTIGGSGYMTKYPDESGYPWYQYREKFSHVVITGEVKSIADYAFAWYTGIQGVDIQSNLEVIGGSAFYKCASLTMLEIPTSVRSIGARSFYGCTGLKTVYYDNSSIDNDGYTFPRTVTHYRAGGTCGEAATWNLTPEYTLIISGTGAVTDKTGWSAYADKIAAVEAAGEITKIGEGMFAECVGLTDITYGGDCKAWEDMGALGYPESAKFVAATHTLKGDAWLSDAESHWHECYCDGKADQTAHVYTKEVIADIYKAGEPDCITNIKYYYSCECGAMGADTFDAPDTALGHIDKNSDGYCDTCKEHVAKGQCGENVTWSYKKGTLTISGTGDMWNYISFRDTPWYKVYNTYYSFYINTVIIEEGVTSIGTSVFYCDYEELTTITIADSVTKIGINAIANCPLLETITLPKNVTEIGENVFYDCPKLESITYEGDCAAWHTFTGLGYPETTEVTIATHSYTEKVMDEAYKAEAAGCTTNAKYYYSCACGLKGTEIFEAENTTEHSWDYYVCCERCREKGYVVAGVEALCGSEWNPKDVNNVMTGNNGIYTKVYENVSEGVYQLKVAQNDEKTDLQFGPAWYGDATGNNINFAVLETSDVTVTFDADTKEITVRGEGVTFEVELEIEMMIAVGNGSGNWLNGVFWDPADFSNIMTEIAEDVYQIQYTGIENGYDYQFKFAANGSWGDDWGLSTTHQSGYAVSGITYDAGYGGGDIWINTTAVSDHTATVILTLDLTEFDYSTKAGAKYTVEVVPEHTDADNDGYCDDCSTIIDGIGARVAGNSLTLDGKIGVNFYMELEADVLEDATAYMEFVLPDGSKKKVLVSDAKRDTATVPGKTYYVFRCDVAAKEMTSDIQATMYLSDGTVKGTTYTYTVEDYARYIIENESSYSAEILALVKAMLNYGATAQTYFAYETDNITSYHDETAYGEVAVTDLAGYVKACGAAITGITYKGSSTVLETDTAIRHYFTLGDGQVIDNFTFMCDGSTEPLAATAKNGMYYVEIPNIAAQDMDVKYTVTVTDTVAGETLTIEYGVFSYLYDALSAGEEIVPVTLKNVARSAYRYCKAAEAYFSSLNSNN